MTEISAHAVLSGLPPNSLHTQYCLVSPEISAHPVLSGLTADISAHPVLSGLTAELSAHPELSGLTAEISAHPVLSDVQTDRQKHLMYHVENQHDTRQRWPFDHNNTTARTRSGR